MISFAILLKNPFSQGSLVRCSLQKIGQSSLFTNASSIFLHHINTFDPAAYTSRQEHFANDYVAVFACKISVDTAENGPLKICQKLAKS